MTTRTTLITASAAATVLLGGAAAAYAATGGLVGTTGRYCQHVERVARTGLPADWTVRQDLAARSPAAVAPARGVLVEGTTVEELLEAQRAVEEFDRVTCGVDRIVPRLPAGAPAREVRWVLAVLNSPHPPTEAEISRHFSSFALERYGGAEATLEAFTEIRSHGPFTLSSLSHQPSDRSLDVRLSGRDIPAALALTVTPDGERIDALDIQAMDHEPFPHSGRYGGRVRIGDRSILLSCAGPARTGAPTVIAYGGSSAEWAPVQRLVAAEAMFCSYDRANTTGSGSDDADNPRTAADVMEDGYQALRAAGVPGPFVVVGHSNAGMAAQLFAAAHPAETAGLLLLDSQSELVPAEIVERLQPLAPSLVADWLVATQAAPPPTPGPEQFDLGGSYRDLAAARTPAPSGLPVTVIRNGRPFPDGLGLPPDVVPAAAQDAAWVAAQDRLASFYGASPSHVAAGVGHDIYVEAPDLVATAVGELLRRVDGTG